jgi:hypothetical protein
MSQTELVLWALDFVITAIAYLIGGPYPAVLAFFTAAILLLIAFRKREGQARSVVVDASAQPYVGKRIMLWHRVALVVSVFILVVLLSYRASKSLDIPNSIGNDAILEWGASQPNRAYLVVDETKLKKFQKGYNIILVVRVSDTTIDWRTDQNIATSAAFIVGDAIRTLSVAMRIPAM